MNLKIKDLIFKINKLVSKNNCIQFINLFEKYKDKSVFQQSEKYIPNVEKQIKIDNYKSLNLSKLYNDNKEIKEATDLICIYFKTMVVNYTQYLKKNISSAIDSSFINKTSNIRILKYSEKELIEDHLDVDPYIRGSCSINLNEDYEGGEFTFFSGKHVEVFKTGDSIIFPAEPIWIHGTKPIKKGTRYSINCFLHS